MTYSPAQSSILDGTDYFRSVGVLQDGMLPIIASSGAFPAFDSTGGTATTITGSVAKSAAASVYSFSAYDITGKSKVLFSCFMHIGAATIGCGIGIHDNTTYGALGADGTSNKNLYQLVTADTYIDLYKTTGAGPLWTEIGHDTTIGNKTVVTTNVVGLAIFADGSNVKTFAKWGTESQWFPVESALDSAHTNYDQVYVRYKGENARFITPVYCWAS